MKKNTRWYLKLAAILCAILLLPACGSDDAENPPPERFTEDPEPAGPQQWYVSSEGGAGIGASHLYTINSLTYETVQVGPIRDSAAVDIYITDLATSPGGVLFGCSFTHLYRIDAKTAEATLVGPIGHDYVVSLDFDPEGFLYGATKRGYVLNINPNDGKGYFLFSLRDGFVASGDLVFAPDGALYASLSRPEVNDSIAVINLPAKTYTILGSGDSGARDIFGLSFHQEQLYGFTARGPSGSDGALWTIDIETGAATFAGDLPFRASGTN